MNKILIIIKREYLTRIRKKSLIVMTFLGPLLFAAMLLAPAWFASIEDEDVKNIAVYDDSWLFFHKIPETAKFKFEYIVEPEGYDTRSFIEDAKENLWQTDFFAFMYIPDYIAYVPQGIEFYSYRQPPANLIMHIANALEKEIEAEKLKSYHIEDIDNILHAVKTRIDIRTFKLSEDGSIKESHNFLNIGVAYVSALLIYLFIFLFGSQVMRGVIEEKTNRIVEIVVSSVKPFQLLMGKVVGIALTGLTQFLAWIALTLILVVLAKSIFLPDLNEEVMQQANQMQTLGSFAADQIQQSESVEKTQEALEMLQSLNFGVLIGCFLFFFMGGYLLYGSLFAAIGSVVDTEADTQQFMLPVTIPLVMSLLVMINVIQNPDGAMAFWFSIFPLTSPIVMMARISFGVPYAEIALSMALLVLAFIGAIWFSAKIYRTGILVYGKKMTYRELWKWLTYK